MTVTISTADDWHRQQYYASLKWANKLDAPSWEELTEEQRSAIRQINMRHQTKMDALAQAISSGGKIDIADFLK